MLKNKYLYRIVRDIALTDFKCYEEKHYLYDENKCNKIEFIISKDNFLQDYVIYKAFYCDNKKIAGYFPIKRSKQLWRLEKYLYSDCYDIFGNCICYFSTKENIKEL